MTFGFCIEFCTNSSTCYIGRNAVSSREPKNSKNSVEVPLFNCFITCNSTLQSQRRGKILVAHGNRNTKLKLFQSKGNAWGLRSFPRFHTPIPNRPLIPKRTTCLYRAIHQFFALQVVVVGMHDLETTCTGEHYDIVHREDDDEEEEIDRTLVKIFVPMAQQYIAC